MGWWFFSAHSYIAITTMAAEWVPLPGLNPCCASSRMPEFSTTRRRHSFTVLMVNFFATSCNLIGRMSS